MAIAYTVKQYLDSNRIGYTVVDIPAATSPIASLAQAAEAMSIAPNSVIQAIVLNDNIGLVLAITPIIHSLDVNAVSKLLHRQLTLTPQAQVMATFPDCKPGFIPALGEPYGVRALLDDSLLQSASDIYFTAGNDTHLIRMNSKIFHVMQRNAWVGGSFVHNTVQSAVSSKTSMGGDIKERVERMGVLPPLPEMARKIIQLSINPKAGANELARLVELDPSLAAQVMRYASSPFFGYAGNVDSVGIAISQVLGYDVVMNLALGVATAKPFKIPQHGPLGLAAFWRHAAYSAALMQALGRAMPESIRPRAGLSFLAGLLHNFGHLMQGHLFKQEFLQINAAVEKNPERPVISIEQEILGADHCQVGSWLMKAWRLPEEVVVTAFEHHNESYSGPHAVYVHLALVTDRMLKIHGIGDSESHDVPPAILDALKINEVQVIMVMNRLFQGSDGLNAMAQQLAT